MKGASLAPTVHSKGDPRLDAVLDFVAFTARPMPLTALLDDVPRQIAAIFRADVCSLYLIEGDGNELVMRGNVGFERHALGQIRLRVGEGITGQAVEYMRPISAETAAQHASYKHFAELSEERFPVFLAVPIRGKKGALGAVVIQRKSKAWAPADIELLTTIGGLIMAIVAHAELTDSQRDKFVRRAGGGTRKVNLVGRPVHPGKVLGAIAALRRPPMRSQAGGNPREDVRLLKGAFDVASAAMVALLARASLLGLSENAGFLHTYQEILGDGRLRERAEELISGGLSIGQAMGQVSREVARAAVSLTRDSFSEDRAHDIEDLCDALAMLAAFDKRTALPNKAIIIGDQITVFDLLISARARPTGVALSDRASGPRAEVLLRLLGAPAVVDVHNLFRWASDGDIALLDGDHGILVVNPSKSEIATVREARKGRGADSEPNLPEALDG